MSSRQITFAQAIREALHHALSDDPSVYVIGLGVPDPKGIFGTTAGLQTEFGRRRVMDMPVSENAMTGIALGSALAGLRPVMVHQRLDFVLLALEQIVNQAAKWRFLFGEHAKAPLVIRLVVGRGWGQGPQHAQSLHGWFAHIPGLKVVMPATAHDAKGLLLASIEDDNPVIFIEHRWLHGMIGDVPEERFRVPLGAAHVMRPGRDVTIVALSYMTIESMRAAAILEEEGLSAEVVDVRTLRPLDTATILDSVRRTGRLLVADPGIKFAGFGAEVSALAAEEIFVQLRCAPRRIACPDYPVPASPALAAEYYPRAVHVAAAVRRMMERSPRDVEEQSTVPLDVPDATFRGPF